MNLLFLDESSVVLSKKRRLVAVTGILVPVSQYESIRARFYRDFSKEQDLSGQVVTTRTGERYRFAPGTKVNPLPPELHAVKLLPDEDDDKKINALRTAVALIRDSALRIYRASLLLDKDGTGHLPTDVARYSECWMLVQDQLESILKTEAVIPVWDAGNLQVTREIPRFHQLRDHLRAHRKGGLSPDPAANLIGEVFFSDSAHSPMIQMADLASYLLLSRDKVECGWQPSDWINRLLKIVPEIPSEILTETRGRLTISGTTRGIVPFTE